MEAHLYEHKKRKRILDGTFLSELDTCMLNARPLVEKKLYGKKLRASELTDYHSQVYSLYTIYNEERVCAQEMDRRMLQEFNYMMKQANELVWRNAATVGLCIAKYGLHLPAEIWHKIVKPALHDKRSEMHAFALRLFKGTEHPTFEVQWVQRIVKRQTILPGERTRDL